MMVELLLVLMLLGYFTLLERKTLGYGQVRKGPNKGVLMGLAQPLLDGFKLFMKGFKGVNRGSMLVFFGVPGLGLCGVLIMWWVVMELLGVWGEGLSLLLIILIGAMISLLFFMSGYLSGCGYSELGSMRALAQALTYEGVMVFSILMVMVMGFSSKFLVGGAMMGFKCILLWLIIVSVVMESSRTPTDFVEGESELVSGLASEMGGLSFTFLFLIEYGLMGFYACFVVVLMSGASLSVVEFIVASLAIMVVLNWLRLSLPRSRYDLVMEWGWKVVLSVVFYLMVVVFSVLLA
uniref:NADH-ubiquinone oxidoreductase chain 1 n=2 Tax=Pomphorhynchus TaxID=60542 RepID=A0A806GUQ9_9BILA|nr:NADH dehydrogenase subunit 1 [Pomphorhynchus tereticollis]YP_010269817.1 NADH dehydrogenase subunit 1 [Pomphorhynchus laevis]AFI44251.1 NADH dehydrogenase subunit 1 [Pomphorhynchus laevis]AFJ14720.1 NADH dehydrogenase subunit 1 [Pomphorhynchus tereticollis]AFJ14732.1 NADH dehydrogenase subunit 1 [Pomphorhynchus tereticollis]